MGGKFAALLALLAAPADAAGDAAGPFGPEVDCAMRSLALRHAAHIQPQISAANLGHVFDSLELEALCNASRPAPGGTPPQPHPPATPGSDALFVDGGSGDDAASGTKEKPLRTVGKAVELAAARKGTKAVVLRGGVHFIHETLELSPQHSGLLISAYCSGSTPCEEAWISGGIELQPAEWKEYDTTGGRNVWSRAVPAAAAAAGANAQSSLHWLDDREGDTVLTRARYPNRRPQDGTVDKPSLVDITATTAVWEQPPSVRLALHKKVEQPSVPLSVTGEFNNWMSGIGGECERFDPPAAAICHPNATGGGYNWDGPGPFFPTGLQLGNASILFPNSSKWAAADMPQAVFSSWTNGWFTSHFDLESFQDGTLRFGPRGGTQGGRGWHFPDDGHKICTGGVRSSDCGPVKIEGLLAELDAPDEYHFNGATAELFLFYNSTSSGKDTSEFDSAGEEQCTAASCTGCACGACNSCACGNFCYTWCKAPHNCACPACNGPNPSPPAPSPPSKPQPPPTTRTLVVPSLKQLIAIRGDYPGSPTNHTPAAPARNITIARIGFRDSSPTFLEPHGIPSGGDWSLQRTAAVFLEGTEGVAVEHCA